MAHSSVSYAGNPVIKDLPAGTIVDGRYEIISRLGEGGMAEVYSAREISLERKIALKFLHAELIGDEDSRLRFEREVKLLAEMSHPNILAPIRYGLWRKEHTAPVSIFPYIAMEFLDGVSLRRVIDECEKLPPPRAFSIAVQISRAMQHAHDQKIIHRDLKPTNIMLVKERDGDLAKVVDFGLARLLETSQTQSQHLTGTGNLIGTVHYMSPEQCKGQKADHRSDIYSVGCILYEMLSGRPPFSADSPMGVIYKHANETLIVEKFGAQTAYINAVLQKALAKLPEQRYQSMRELQEDLELLAKSERKLKHASFERVSNPSSVSAIALAASALVAVAGCFTVAAVSKYQSGVATGVGDSNQASLKTMNVAIEKAQQRFEKELKTGHPTVSSANLLFENLASLEMQSWQTGLTAQAAALAERRAKLYPYTDGMKKAMITCDLEVFDRCRAEAKRAYSLQRANWLLLAKTAIDRADSVAPKIGSPLKRAEIAITRCYWELDDGKIDEAVQSFSECYQSLEPAADGLTEDVDSHVARLVGQLDKIPDKADTLSNEQILDLSEMAAKIARIATLRANKKTAQEGRSLAVSLLSSRFPTAPKNSHELEQYNFVKAELESQSKLKQGDGGRNLSKRIF